LIYNACSTYSCVVNAYDGKQKTKNTNNDNEDDEVIDLNSDDETNNENNFKCWYSTYLKSLEQKYPAVFDEVVKNLLKSEAFKSSKASEAVKMAIGL